MKYPPLSQSRHGDMACALLFQAIHIRGLRVESEAARRGSEIHKLIATYMDHLNITKQQTDYNKLSALAADASPESKEILETFCASWFVDSEKIYDTELYIGLDENMMVLEAHGQAQREDKRPEGVAYEGSLDLVIMESEIEATIDDWKSYWQIVDAESFQSKFYPLMLFLLNPRLEKVHFVLHFVRYGSAVRSVTWTKEDVPKLMDLARRERKRMVELYDRDPKTLKVTPGRHCTWCPLLTTECPMKELNPYAQMTLEQRVAFGMWLKLAEEHNTKIIKDYVAQNGPVAYADGNNKTYSADFVKIEKKSYPLVEAIELLQPYWQSHPEDRTFVKNLRVSGLRSPLKAKKRFELSQQLENVAQVKTQTKFTIGEPDEDAEGEPE